MTEKDIDEKNEERKNEIEGQKKKEEVIEINIFVPHTA